jgi:hypothetical protein
MGGFLARGPALAVVAIAAALALMPVQAACATGFRDAFGDDNGGWRDFVPGGPAVWLSSGGNPGGNIAGTATGQGSAAGVWSPTDWAGDRSNAYGGVLSFDAQVDEGRTGTLHVRLDSHSPDNSLGYGGFRVTDRWKHFEVPLRATPDWGSTNGPVTKISFIAALSNLEFVALPVVLDTSFTAAYFDNITFASNLARKLTLHFGDRRFAGRLTPSGGCARQQKVVVRRQRNGSDQRIGSDRTDSSGQYSIPDADPAHGAYYAQVTRAFRAGVGNCLPAKSKSEKVR